MPTGIASRVPIATAASRQARDRKPWVAGHPYPAQNEFRLIGVVNIRVLFHSPELKRTQNAKTSFAGPRVGTWHTGGSQEGIGEPGSKMD
jgi:hypothetical protein